MGDSGRLPLHVRPKTIEKPWGHEEIFEINPSYVIKKLFINAGHRLSVQYHDIKHETLIAVSGKIWLRKGSVGTANAKVAAEWPKDEGTLNKFVLHQGSVEVIEPCTIHQIIAEEDSIILECSTPELDDVVRLEDVYGRV